jgi:hypothetical protein
MREIKFRAFRPFPDPIIYYFTLDDLIFNTFNKQPLLDYSGVREGIEQYTGLHDKNGKEIYEGDIIKCWLDFGPGGESQRICKVYINGYKSGPMMEWNYEENYLPEVIGNIHENPELLK